MVLLGYRVLHTGANVGTYIVRRQLSGSFEDVSVGFKYLKWQLRD